MRNNKYSYSSFFYPLFKVLTSYSFLKLITMQIASNINFAISSADGFLKSPSIMFSTTMTGKIYFKYFFIFSIECSIMVLALRWGEAVISASLFLACLIFQVSTIWLLLWLVPLFQASLLLSLTSHSISSPPFYVLIIS